METPAFCKSLNISGNGLIFLVNGSITESPKSLSAALALERLEPVSSTAEEEVVAALVKRASI